MSQWPVKHGWSQSRKYVYSVCPSVLVFVGDVVAAAAAAHADATAVAATAASLSLLPLPTSRARTRPRRTRGEALLFILCSVPFLAAVASLPSAHSSSAFIRSSAPPGRPSLLCLPDRIAGRNFTIQRSSPSGLSAPPDRLLRQFGTPPRRKADMYQVAASIARESV